MYVSGGVYASILISQKSELAPPFSSVAVRVTLYIPSSPKV
jgi:hypothetical protein